MHILSLYTATVESFISTCISLCIKEELCLHMDRQTGGQTDRVIRIDLPPQYVHVFIILKFTKYLM